MARVIRSIFTRLTDTFDIVQMAVGYTGDPVDHPWPLYPAGAAGDPLGVNRLSALVPQLRPDLLFILHETATTGRYLKRLRELIDPARIVVYLPLNSEPVAEPFVRMLANVGAVVVPTRFAQSAILAATSAHDVGPINCGDIIPHGVDTDLFAPLDGGRAAARRHLRIPDPDDSFIVLNANANRPWKAVDATVRGFALFAAGKPAGVRLFLHMGLRDCGWDLAELTRRCGVLDRCLFSTRQPSPPILQDADLNAIYNACEVGINTALCEGWGLVSFEHAATGAAQIVPRHTGCGELWDDDRATMIEPGASVVHPASMEQMHHVAAETVAAALERLYVDRDYLASQSAAARAFATRQEFTWETIGGQWRRVFVERLSGSELPRGGLA